MTDHRLEPLAGEPGQLGYFERVYSSDIAPEVPEPHHHLYGVAAVVPFKLIALEVFPEKGGSYGNPHEWVALDSILFTDLGRKTPIVFLQAHLEMGRQQEARRSEPQDDAPMRRRLERYFDNLRQLLG